ncbi:hypothetical protein TUM4438_46570 [Shewanella sairae]|uniref:Uncharacterized protein n=1 Tax=Shewanella sairae TaxID=190310 RepID=A0ABQ4PS85_9GAMM|nr:hypothetical protein [Shewanella sairae]MCL1132746.1 hypothetical protein [Shewanella sairae]GIU52960.1 hypothetical protein TUM4438_46570 [Shewanella sairae]
MKVTVSALTNLSENEQQWLRHFRRSKCMNTLDIQCEGAERKHAGNPKELNDINTAWCAREQELLSWH